MYWYIYSTGVGKIREGNGTSSTLTVQNKDRILNKQTNNIKMGINQINKQANKRFIHLKKLIIPGRIQTTWRPSLSK